MIAQPTNIQPVCCHNIIHTFSNYIPLQQTESRILQSLEQANAQQELSKSLLRLTYLLQTCMQNSNTQSAIELLMTQPTLLENLRKAYMGNYGVILSLLGCLDQGLHAKKLVDRVIDASMFFSLSLFSPLLFEC